MTPEQYEEQIEKLELSIQELEQTIIEKDSVIDTLVTKLDDIRNLCTN